MLDSVLNLRRDVAVYAELLNGLERNGKKLSKSMKMKTSAVFADVCTFIHVLKFESNVSWSATIFGPETIVVQKDDSLFNRNVSFTRILDNTDPTRWPFKYSLLELSDPILFTELLGILTALTPGEISWLATHRTLGHTRLCVTNDLWLWIFHVNRILERLGRGDGKKILKTAKNDSFISMEIDQAAKDIKQVLFKLKNKDKLRYRLPKKLMGLATKFPIAKNIANSIEEPKKISPIIVLRNKARRNLTTIFRLYLSNCGVVPDNRKKRTKSMQVYIKQLETQLNRLSSRYRIHTRKLKRAIEENEEEKVMPRIGAVFRILAKFDNIKLWESRDVPLDRWLLPKDK